MSSVVLVTAFLANTSLPPRLQEGLAALLSQQCEAVAGWSWEAGEPAPAPAPNLGGVIANALLDAYQRAPDAATWVTLVQYAHALAEHQRHSGGLPFKADIEFLARLGAAGIDANAAELARRMFARLRAVSPTGRDEYARVAQGRREITAVMGYDMALAIRAALAVGERRYAQEIADATLASGVLVTEDHDDWFAITSVGAMLQALALFAEPRYAAAIAALSHQLVRIQAADGAWAMNNTQATAYAVLGLGAVRTARARDAARAGRDWLFKRQLTHGAWAAYHDGLPEPFVGPVLPLVEAETLAALVAPQP